MIDYRAYNREAWNRQVEEGNKWTVPVSPEEIAAARRGDWKIVMTPLKPVPRAWYPPLEGLPVLCLASGGGQQSPILAAAGAQVTVLDNSPRQLDRDREVAQREGLEIRTVEGDMRDLSAFADASFGLIIHPVSNLFVPDVLPIWRESFRVLRPGGVLITGMMNPAVYIFDLDLMDAGELKVVNRLPYADIDFPEKLKVFEEKGWPLEWSHSLEDAIGGQLEAGFVLTGFYEDGFPEFALDRYMPTFYATRAVKPSAPVG